MATPKRPWRGWHTCTWSAGGGPTLAEHYAHVLDHIGDKDRALRQFLSEFKLHYGERAITLLRWVTEGGDPCTLARWWAVSGQLGNRENIEGVVRIIEQLGDGTFRFSNGNKYGKMSYRHHPPTWVEVPFDERDPAIYEEAAHILRVAAGLTAPKKGHKQQTNFVLPPVRARQDWVPDPRVTEEEPFGGGFTEADC